MNTFTDMFNAEYSASLDKEIVKLNVDTNGVPGLRINNLNFWSVVRKVPYYQLPNEIVEFMNTFTDASTNVFADTSTCSPILSVNVPKIHKLHANTLKLIAPRECVISNINILSAINYRMPNPNLINLADWVIFMTERSNHLKFFIYCVNCNPASNQYGNIMLVRDNGGFVSINIPYTSISALMQELTDWLTISAPPVTIDSIDRCMNSVCMGWICKIVGREITGREALTIDNIPGLVGDITDKIKEYILRDMFTFIHDITLSSFSLYVINDQW